VYQERLDAPQTTGRPSGTNFDGFNGIIPLKDHDRRPTLMKVRDGLTNTLLLIECVGRPYMLTKAQGQLQSVPGYPNNTTRPEGGWARPRSSYGRFGGMTFDGIVPSDACAVNCANFSFNPNNGNVGTDMPAPFSTHPGVANISMGDGSVRSISQGIAVRDFARLVTRELGEISPDF
jgi:prepilin-type processing-associated H-X9-DG protein